LFIHLAPLAKLLHLLTSYKELAEDCHA
jgi:hypothetical protein